MTARKDNSATRGVEPKSKVREPESKPRSKPKPKVQRTQKVEPRAQKVEPRAKKVDKTEAEDSTVKAIDFAKTTDSAKTIDPARLQAVVKRSESSKRIEQPAPPPSVSAGPIEKVIELAFNPSRDKIREMTVVDRSQGRMLPQLDMINSLFHYCIEIATYRQSAEEYAILYGRRKPMPPDLLDDLVYRTAQWQKSVAGKNLERAIDLALAEQEAKAGEEGDSYSGDAWKE